MRRAARIASVFATSAAVRPSCTTTDSRCLTHVMQRMLEERAGPSEQHSHRDLEQRGRFASFTHAVEDGLIRSSLQQSADTL